MSNNTRHNFLSVMAIAILVAFAFLATSSTNTLAQTARENAHVTTTQQPLYSAYRGVRIGMSATDVRAKLGVPLQKSDDLDLFVFSDQETAQIAYDKTHNVRGISVDFMGGVGAPDYKAVVGSDIEVSANGALYKLVRYDSLGFWVSYNRTAGELFVVTITIQKNL